MNTIEDFDSSYKQFVSSTDPQEHLTATTKLLSQVRLKGRYKGLLRKAGAIWARTKPKNFLPNFPLKFAFNF